MEKILILNSGSTTVKFQLFRMDKGLHQVISSGVIDRIGQLNSKMIVKSGNTIVHESEIQAPNHKLGIKAVLEYLLKKDLNNIDELSAVGHRMGHGGELFSGSVIITDEVMRKIQSMIPLMPLHGPAFIEGEKAISALLPNILQVATFDNAFHQTQEKSIFNYAIPHEYYDKEKIRRYGFHGASHAYSAKKASEFFGKKGRFITCHLGGGASICAIKDGKSVETSMGYTPTSGIIMSTRTGDIDPYIPLHIMKTQNKTPDDVDKMFNKESGLCGISEGHTDMRDIIEQAKANNDKCQLALDMFIYSVLKTIGAYVATLGGVDAIVFTGGIGENSALIRQRLCEKLSYLGLVLDKEKNEMKKNPYEISAYNSKVKVYVIPANEELMMAEDTYELLLTQKELETVAV